MVFLKRKGWSAHAHGKDLDLPRESDDHKLRQDETTGAQRQGGLSRGHLGHKGRNKDQVGFDLTFHKN